MIDSSVIEILIDNSGSMGLLKGSVNENKYLIDGCTRMSIVKKILVHEVIDAIDYVNNVFIRTFANDYYYFDKYEPFFSSHIIYKGIFDKQKIIESINKINDPTQGGTPISRAIEVSITNLKNFPLSDRKIIILTDGEENGGGDYIEFAKKIKELPGVPCKVFIIGIAQNEEAEIKSRSIADGGYCNIKSKTFNPIVVRNLLAPFKIAILSDTIKNIKSSFIDQVPVSHDFPLKSNIISDNFPEIDTTTLTIDTEYSEYIREKSESFLNNILCQKYGENNVNWLNKFGESNLNHDFELLDNFGFVSKIIECKGTAYDKPTFYLTSSECFYFLENKDEMGK